MPAKYNQVLSFAATGLSLGGLWVAACGLYEQSLLTVARMSAIFGYAKFSVSLAHPSRLCLTDLGPAQTTHTQLEREAKSSPGHILTNKNESFGVAEHHTGLHLSIISSTSLATFEQK